jgi:LytS/YehU family sensor histidine kinase
VRHGISLSEAAGRIAVRSSREGESLVIEIFNSGRLEAARKNGIGLTTTAARLAELYGAHACIELSEHEGGVLARVTLPFREVS